MSSKTMKYLIIGVAALICLCVIIGKITGSSKVDNTKPSTTTNTKVENTAQPATTPDPSPSIPEDSEDVGVADPRDPDTWKDCTGEEDWYDDMMEYGSNFNYDEWLYYQARLENNYDESGYLIYPDEEEYLRSDDPTDYDARQYYGNVGLTGPYWEQENPYGYFKHGYFSLDNMFGMYASQTQMFEFDAGLSIAYVPGTDEIEFKYFLSYQKMKADTEPNIQFRVNAKDILGKENWTLEVDGETFDCSIVHLDQNNMQNASAPGFDCLAIRIEHEGYHMLAGSYYIQYFYK